MNDPGGPAPPQVSVRNNQVKKKFPCPSSSTLIPSVRHRVHGLAALDWLLRPRQKRLKKRAVRQQGRCWSLTYLLKQKKGIF
jgi:hypothetical protein